MMRLSDFPVPRNRSKRGVHWSASCYPAHADYQWHIARMAECKIGWLKFLSDGNGQPGVGDSGLQFGIYALQHGLMPVVRFYCPADHRWTDANSYAIEAYVRAGIRYIETVNEPDLGYEWSGGHLPADWAERAFGNWLEHARNIRRLGGIPLTPALASGFLGARGEGAGQLNVNPFSILADAGINDFVCSIHNYPLNHPIDYPYDAVNQAGAALTLEAYEEAGGDIAWDRPQNVSVADWITQINAQRMRDKNPGHTVFDDDSCFLAVEVFRKLLDEAGYRHIPILTTEGGPCLTDRQDGRYPRVTPSVMQEMIAQELDYLARHDWYLGYCWWLWGNPSIGGTGGWSTNQWYWPGGSFSDSQHFIPAVSYLRDKPLETGGAQPPQAEPPAEEEPTVINDAEEYGVNIEAAKVAAGQRYYKAVRVHHYLPNENGAWPGMHHLFLDVLDSNGARLRGARLVVHNIGNDSSTAVFIDKPDDEPGTNVPIMKNDTLRVYVSHPATDPLPSDIVYGIHTRHPDEGGSNNAYHHSFLVVFQLVTKAEEQPAPVEQTTTDDIRNAAWNNAYPSGGIAWNPDAAFQREARLRGLGAPVTNEFDVGQYRAQGFSNGILYAVIGDWEHITLLSW